MKDIIRHQATLDGRSFYFDSSDDYNRHWYLKSLPNNWEPESFTILKKYLKPGGFFIDVGAWIGPLSLYASSVSKMVYAIEPDKVAYNRLIRNVAANPEKNNIVCFDVAIGAENGSSRFGGNGELGNSMSTLLAGSNEYLETGGEIEHRRHTERSWREQEITNVKTVLFSSFLEENSINLGDVDLIKVDIEGGEYIIVDSFVESLGEFRPPIYLSLHWYFLKKEEIIYTVEKILEKYSKIYDENGEKITLEEIVERRSYSICFE